MSHTPLQPVAAPAADGPEAFMQRCRDLGLAVWSFDGAGGLRAKPSVSGPAGEFLLSGPVQERIEAALAVRATLGWTTREAAPGLVLIAVDHRRGGSAGAAGRVRSITVAAAVACDGLEPPHADLLSLIRAAGMDPSLVVPALKETAVYSRAAAERLAPVLSEVATEMTQGAHDAAALAGHSAQLAEMYEEIGLLYRLGQSMNGLTAPDVFVHACCEELAATLPFRWIAVKFAESVRVAPMLADSLTVSGDLPIACTRGRLGAGATDLLPTLKPDRWTLLKPGEAADAVGIAAAAGAPVLAHPICRQNEVVGVLLAGNRRGPDGRPDTEITSFETQLLDAGADYLGVFVENASLYAEQQAMFIGTIEALTAAIDAKDRYTCGHSERVAHLGRQLALAMGMDEPSADRVRLTGLLHDVGKIGVPEAVLCKPGKLSDAEFEQIKLHPVIGHRILRDIPMLQDVLPGVLYHHERWDGKGYPERLSGEGIPVVARLLAVADSFDAMSSNRAYRAAMPREKVLAEIARCAGAQFDPDMARKFVTLDLSVYEAMVERHRGHEFRAAA